MHATQAGWALRALVGVLALAALSIGTGHPLPAAVANAVVFAWFIGVTFPLEG